MREIETFNQEKEFQYHHVQILFTLFICMSFGLGVWVSKSDFNTFNAVLVLVTL